MSDAPGSLSVGLGSWSLPEDRRLGEPHDLAEAPRIGCVERPVLPLELPGLLGGILRQRPLRSGEWLSKSPVALPLAIIGHHYAGVRLGALRLPFTIGP